MVGQYGQLPQPDQARYNPGQYAESQQYGTYQPNGADANEGTPGAPYGAGQYGQTQQQADAQQYGYGQQGVTNGGQAADTPYSAIQTSATQTSGAQDGQAQYGAGQYGTDPLYVVGPQADAAAQGAPSESGNPQAPSQAVSSQPATSVSGPQPVLDFPPAQPLSGQPAGQSPEAGQTYPGEQHHEQAGAQRPFVGQLSYDDHQGYDDHGYAAPGREEQMAPELEFSASFGNRGYPLYGDAAEANTAALSGQANGTEYGVRPDQRSQTGGHALAGQQGDSAQEESAASQYSQFGPPSAQPQRAQQPQQSPEAGQPQLTQESGRFPQFAQSLATLSAPVPADAAAEGQWSPPGQQASPSSGTYPAYAAAQPQHAYQDQPAYQGVSGPHAAGDAAGGMDDYRTAAADGQQAAPVANGYAYPDAAYTSNGYAPNGSATNGSQANGNAAHGFPGYGNGGQSGTGAFPVPGYANSGAFPVNGQDSNGYYTSGYQPNGQQPNGYESVSAPGAGAFPANGQGASNGQGTNGYPDGEHRPGSGVPQSGGVPTFTPAFSPNGGAGPRNGAAGPQNGTAAHSAVPNGNGRGGRPGQPQRPSSGAYPDQSSYQQAPRSGPGQPDAPYQSVPGYSNVPGAGYAGTGSYPIANGQEYPPGPQPDWQDGYPAAAQPPVPGYPAGPGQGYPDEYPQQAGRAANGGANGANGANDYYAPGRQTGPLTAADHASSPGYAPPDQFDPPQQGYWQ